MPEYDTEATVQNTFHTHKLFISITHWLGVVTIHFKMDHLFRVPEYVTEATVQKTFHM